MPRTLPRTSGLPIKIMTFDGESLAETIIRVLTAIISTTYTLHAIMKNMIFSNAEYTLIVTFV